MLIEEEKKIDYGTTTQYFFITLKAFHLGFIPTLNNFYEINEKLENLDNELKSMDSEHHPKCNINLKYITNKIITLKICIY